MKFLKLAVITVCAFLVCWLPISTCRLLIAFGKSCESDVGSTLFTLAFLNSLINPFIYFASVRKRPKIMSAKRVVGTKLTTGNSRRIRKSPVLKQSNNHIESESGMSATLENTEIVNSGLQPYQK